MYYHPADSSFIYNHTNEKQVENLWYKVHYFQQISLAEKNNDRLKRLEESITLPEPARNIVEALLATREYHLSQLSLTHGLAILKASFHGRLVHGMGGAHVRETAITLHPLYGIPYIPASSLKGAVRGWGIQAFFNGQEGQMQDKDTASVGKQQLQAVFGDLFGNQERSGQLQFYDAFFKSDFSLVPDVLTVHFPEYYSGKKAAGDDQAPNPVSFYTVEAGELEIILTLALHRPMQSGLSSQELMSLAAAWTANALVEQGIGSKRSSGYGFFDRVEDISLEKLSALQKRHLQEISQHKKNLKARQITEEKAKREAEIVRAKEKMSPAQQLVFDIQQLSQDDKDKDLSKSKHYPQVLVFAQAGDLAPVSALKEYWERNGLWKVKSANKKQAAKVNEIKKLLGE